MQSIIFQSFSSKCWKLSCVFDRRIYQIKQLYAEESEVLCAFYTHLPCSLCNVDFLCLTFLSILKFFHPFALYSFVIYSLYNAMYSFIMLHLSMDPNIKKCAVDDL